MSEGFAGRRYCIFETYHGKEMKTENLALASTLENSCFFLMLMSLVAGRLLLVATVLPLKGSLGGCRGVLSEGRQRVQYMSAPQSLGALRAKLMGNRLCLGRLPILARQLADWLKTALAYARTLHYFTRQSAI